MELVLKRDFRKTFLESFVILSNPLGPHHDPSLSRYYGKCLSYLHQMSEIEFLGGASEHDAFLKNPSEPQFLCHNVPMVLAKLEMENI